MIEIIVELISSWLADGSKKGWQAILRKIILYPLFLGLACLGVYLYIINLAEMGILKSAVIGIALLMFYGMSGFIYWAVKHAGNDLEK